MECESDCNPFMEETEEEKRPRLLKGNMFEYHQNCLIFIFHTI